MFLKEHNSVAFIYKEIPITYKQLIQKVKEYASLLDIKTDDRVAIFSENRPEWAISFFSIWHRGGIPVPVDFMSTPEEVAYVLNDCKPSYIFCSKNNESVVKEALKQLDYTPEVLVFEDIKPKDTVEQGIEREKDDIAVILYTSGTTGNPKGVMLTYDNLYSNIEGIVEVNIASQEDKTIAILPFHHSYPLMVSLLIPMYLGATVVFLDKLSAEDILNKLQKYKVPIIVGVPRLYTLFHRKIFEQINKNFVTKLLFRLCKTINNQKLSKVVFKKVHDTFGGNIRYFVSGGAKLDKEIAEDLWALGFKIIEGYGLTETSPIITFNPPDKIKLGSVGKPIKDVQVKIENDEVVVKGRNVMKGYYNRPEETKKVLKNGWLYTGDLGFIDDEGYLYITGRKKDIIVLPNGKNINPEEIEQKLLKLSPLIKEVVVIEENGKLIAVIYPDFQIVNQRKIVNIEETIKWEVIDVYNQHVPDYKRISGIKIVKRELPKTRLGKVRRFLIQDFLKEETEKKSFEKEPDFEEYRIIKEYLQKVVKRDVSPSEHIEIDLGLDSLEKVELQAFLEKTFGVSITDEELASYPTVKELAEFVKERKTKIEIEEVDWSKLLKEDVDIDISENEYSLIIVKKVLKPIFKVYFRLEVEGIENIPESPFILTPNHQSYLDGFLIVSSLPDNVLKHIYFLAEEKYFPLNTLRGKAGKFFHILTVNINRNLKGSLQKTAMLLKRGKSVVIFPEGARTRTGELLEFKKSFAILSKELNVPVVPLVIKGAYESMPIGSPFPKPKKITLKFLEPIYPDDMSYEEITEKTKQMIEKELYV